MNESEGQRFGLAPLTLADRDLFARCFARIPQPLSDYSFANVFIWRSSLSLYWARLEGHLCLFANGRELSMLMPPMATDEAAPGSLGRCLDRCFELMDAYNDAAGLPRSLARIEYVSAPAAQAMVAAAPPRLGLAAQPMSGDYIYAMPRMIDLAGGSLKSKRHARSRFLREHPDHACAPLQDHHLPDCLALLHVWHEHGDQAHLGEATDAMVATAELRRKEVAASRLALQRRHDLGLTGLTLWADGRLIGFTLGECLTVDQASILIEKTHPEYHGAAQFIFAEFCRRCWASCQECNVGDDWGIPSLRFTKESYRPVRRLTKFTLIRTPTPGIVITSAPTAGTTSANAGVRA